MESSLLVSLPMELTLTDILSEVFGGRQGEKGRLFGQ